MIEEKDDILQPVVEAFIDEQARHDCGAVPTACKLFLPRELELWCPRKRLQSQTHLEQLLEKIIGFRQHVIDDSTALDPFKQAIKVAPQVTQGNAAWSADELTEIDELSVTVTSMYLCMHRNS